MGKIVDDRVGEQFLSHTYLVIGTDKFLSGWGEVKAKGGRSYAAWACRPEHLPAVKRWVERRTDMKRVRTAVSTNYRPRLKDDDHFHIYVVDDRHPALKKGGKR